jgi:single-stranded-DNA-specific exonuclease
VAFPPLAPCASPHAFPPGLLIPGRGALSPGNLLPAQRLEPLVQEEPLAERITAAVDLLQGLPERKRVTVVADADVDGTAAAAVLARALHATNRRFTVTLTRRRDQRLVELIQQRAPSLLITADLGATLIAQLSRLRIPTIVLDHHEPDGDGDGSGFIQVNPHLVGEDGSTTASGAAVAYRFAEAWLKQHKKPAQDLLPLALLGAWGDRYHGADDEAGLHHRLVQQAQASEQIAWHPWVPAAPRASPILDALLKNLDPMVPHFHGEPEKASQTLEALGIPPTARLDEIEETTWSKLCSWLAAGLLEEGADGRLVAKMLSPHPTFPEQSGPLAGLTIPEVAMRIDSGTRQDHAPTALAALLGSQDAWDRLEEGLPGYRSAVTEPVWKAANAAIRLGPGHLVRVEAGWSAGPVADRLMAWTRLGRAPVIVMGAMPRGWKLSLRARNGTPWRLDRVASESARAAGGVGGGHRLAAGALVPQDKEAVMLEKIAAALRQEAQKHGLQAPPDPKDLQGSQEATT